MRKILVYMLGLLSISGIIFSCIYFLTASDKEGGILKKDSDSSIKTARVVANGDIILLKREMEVMILIRFLNMLNRG